MEKETPNDTIGRNEIKMRVDLVEYLRAKKSTRGNVVMCRRCFLNYNSGAIKTQVACHHVQ